MNIFPIIAAACPELGTNPVRFYEGVAPQEEVFPYATYQYVRAIPFNDLAGFAGETVTIQVDVWGREDSRTLAKKMRVALNNHGYVTFWDSSREDGLSRTTFQFQVIQNG